MPDKTYHFINDLLYVLPLLFHCHDLYDQAKFKYGRLQRQKSGTENMTKHAVCEKRSCTSNKNDLMIYSQLIQFMHLSHKTLLLHKLWFWECYITAPFSCDTAKTVKT